jgi:hypothetical protein
MSGAHPLKGVLHASFQQAAFVFLEPLSCDKKKYSGFVGILIVFYIRNTGLRFRSE